VDDNTPTDPTRVAASPERATMSDEMFCAIEFAIQIKDRYYPNGLIAEPGPYAELDPWVTGSYLQKCLDEIERLRARVATQHGEIEDMQIDNERQRAVIVERDARIEDLHVIVNRYADALQTIAESLEGHDDEYLQGLVDIADAALNPDRDEVPDDR